MTTYSVHCMAGQFKAHILVLYTRCFPAARNEDDSPLLRILLVDDHAVLRRGVEALIERASLGTVCGEAADGEEAIRLAQNLKPDLIIMDISMPKLNGIDAARRIREFDPNVKILILTMHDPSQLVGLMKEAGANGVLEKTSAEEHLARAIHTVTSGGPQPRSLDFSGSVKV